MTVWNRPIVRTLLFVWTFSLVLSLSSSTSIAGPPNVILILSDDQAWTDYGFMGHDTIQTPRLDKLAAESATFTRGYVPDSLCRPSLATLITGLYPHQHRISGNDPVVPRGTPKRGEVGLALNRKLIQHIEEVPTLPRLLSKQGYVSFQSGKWWEGNYARGGFTHGMTHGDNSRGGRHGDAGLQIGRQGLKPITDFIDAAGEKPYFVWYAPFLPHSPHTPPQRLLDKYTAEGKSIHVAKYQAMCEWFDETCGELLDYVDKKGQRENTIVIYVCDNGWIQDPETPHYAPRSKRSQYDGGVRTPIMIRWPGHITPARYDNTLISSIDFAPTVLAAAGIEKTPEMPGLDLVQIAKAGGKIDRNLIFGEIFEHDVEDVDRPAASLMYRWCIQENMKLILPNSANEQVELFDVVADPFELKNLAADHPDLVAKLTQEIDSWWKP